MDFVERIRFKMDSVKNKSKRIWKDHLLAKSYNRDIRENVVFYEAFDGAGLLCNPFSIFSYLLEDSRYRNLEHVWSIRSPQLLNCLRVSYATHKNVSFVLYKSADYFNKLSSSKYLINNSTFPAEFIKKSNQIYLNTWHGVPLKKMGYDVVGGRLDTKNVVRNFLATDYLVSNSRFMTERIYGQAFKLEGIYNGSILESGFPRTDQLHNKENSRLIKKELLEERCLPFNGKKIVLFAPTWRGANPYDVESQFKDIERSVQHLQSLLGNDYLVIYKLHQLAERSISSSDLPSIAFDSSIDTNRILSIADILITDYSSIFFDFLILDRPIHFLFSDLDDYSKTRGVYDFDVDLPGVISFSLESLAESILSGDVDVRSDLKNRRTLWKDGYCIFDDGLGTKRVVDLLFDGPEASDHIYNFSSTKERILIHPGSLIANGITTAAINLISSLDYEKYDVTIIFPYSPNGFQQIKANEIDPRARLIARVGRVAMTFTERRPYWNYTKGGGNRAAAKDIRIARRIFAREWRRCFSDTEFDISIGFDGYQVFWSQLILQSKAKTRLLWAHNDLQLDAHRMIDGSKPHYDNLTSLFSLYNEFDAIVSVTEDLCRINSQKLGSYAPGARFVSLRNFLDAEKIRSLSEEPNSYSFDKNCINFVTVGRLSPEKNQARILRAFSKVAERYPNARLIVVGDGPLRTNLESLAISLGLSARIVFLGLQINPYPIMKNADCFVFSSDYEGQGLAILESLVLKTPVITTRFNVVDSVLGQEDGVIVPSNDGDLAAAMMAFCERPLPEPTFDPLTYNCLAVSELNRILSISDGIS